MPSRESADPRRCSAGASYCVETLFRDLPDLLSRISAAASLNLTQVEAWEVDSEDVNPLRAMLDSAGLRLVLMTNAPHSSPLDPQGRDRYLTTLRKNLKTAKALGVDAVTILGDLPTKPPSAGREEYRPSAHEIEQALLGFLGPALQLAKESGTRLLLEPLNSRIDHPGHFFDDFDLAASIVSRLGSSSVRLLFDIYHASVMGVEPARFIETHHAIIGHVHVADSPGRGEPFSGRIDWKRVTGALADVCYDGLIGLECFPSGKESTAISRFMATIGRSDGDDADKRIL